VGFGINCAAGGASLQNGDFNAHRLICNKLVSRIANYALVGELLRRLCKSSKRKAMQKNEGKNIFHGVRLIQFQK
jgi:hypothetical protein